MGPRQADGPCPTRALPAGALAVLAPRPAAGPALAFLQFLLGPQDAALSGARLLGVLDPADELVAGEGRDVLPGIERRRIGDQCGAQISWKLVHDPTGHSRAVHRKTVAAQGAAACPTKSAWPPSAMNLDGRPDP